jgi:nucleoside-diphosphate-sugar epimerase
MTGNAILVTGIGGLIGGAAARRRAADGRAVVGMDREAIAHQPFPMITHDLPDPQRWHDVIVRFGIRKVVHAGGIFRPML